MSDVRTPPAGTWRPPASGAAAAFAVLGVAGAGGAAVLAAGGRFGAGAIAAAVAGVATYAAGRRAAGSPLGAFALGIVPRIPDAAVAAGIAWHFRESGRTGAVAASVVALTFLAAYARTRAHSLGFACETPPADLLRYAGVVAALAVPRGAEAACWALAVLTAVEFGRVFAEAWRNGAGT